MLERNIDPDIDLQEKAKQTAGFVATVLSMIMVSRNTPTLKDNLILTGSGS